MRSRTAEPAGSPRDKDQDWSAVASPAIRELLDYLADELAKEYIRLMKQVADDGDNTNLRKGGSE